MACHDIFIKTMENMVISEKYNLFDDLFIVLNIAEYIDILNKNISNIVSSIDKGLKIIKTKLFFRISCLDNIDCSIKVVFKDNFVKNIGIYTGERSENNINLGVKNYIDEKTQKFWEEYSVNSKYVDSMYFEASKDSNLEYFSKIINCCLILGVKNIFFAYSNKDKIFDTDYLLKLSATVDFLNITLNKYQKIFIIIEDISLYIPNLYQEENIDIDTGQNLLEVSLKNISDIFSETCIIPVFPIIFSPVACLLIDSPSIFPDRIVAIRNKGNSSGTYINSIINNLFKYLAFDVSCISLILNNDDWMNYIFFINIISKITSTEIILYNIPAGHSNSTLEISPYTKIIYNRHTDSRCDYSGTAPLFFFGGKESMHIILINECNDIIID